MNVAALCFANVAAPRRGHSFDRELRNSFALAVTATALRYAVFSALASESIIGAAIGRTVAAIRRCFNWAELGALLGNRYKGTPMRAEGALRRGQCTTISIFG
jgi:hypothetical protein